MTQSLYSTAVAYREGEEQSVNAEQLRKQKTASDPGTLDKDASSPSEVEVKGDAMKACLDSRWEQLLVYCILFTVLIILPGILTRIFSPESEVADMSVVAWAIILGTLVLSWAVLTKIYQLGGVIVIAFAQWRKHSPAKVGGEKGTYFPLQC